MPNYESTSYHVEQDYDPEKSVAYSTYTDRDSDTPNPNEVGKDDYVLRVWHTTRLPDGQAVNVEVLHTADDVKGLQSFLNDNFSRLKNGSRGPVPVAPIEDVHLPVQPDYTPGPEAYDRVLVDAANAAGYDVPQVRRCPHISNGVQCEYAEHADTSYPHSFEAPAWDGYQTNASTPPQTSDGVATPPATAPTTTPVAPGGEQAAESATIARTVAAAPSDAPKTRTRRKKEEKAYDDALEAYSANQGNETWGPLIEAYEALKNRLPDNPRIGAAAALGLGGPQEASGFHPANENTAPAAAPGPSFAPEPGGQPVAPWMEAPVLAGAGPSFQPWSAPVAAPDQQFAQAVASVDQAEQQAAQAFPCPATSSDGRHCVRPFGHELQTANNPEPKPHVYATEPSTLQGQYGQQPAAAVPMQPMAPAPAQPGFTVSTPIANPVGSVLPYAVPPTPEQPNIPPSAPVWQQPNGPQ